MKLLSLAALAVMSLSSPVRAQSIPSICGVVVGERAIGTHKCLVNITNKDNASFYQFVNLETKKRTLVADMEKSRGGYVVSESGKVYVVQTKCQTKEVQGVTVHGCQTSSPTSNLTVEYYGKEL